MIQYLSKRAQTTYFQQFLTMFTSIFGLIGGSFTIRRYFKEAERDRQREFDYEFNLSIERLQGRYERMDLPKCLHDISDYQKHVEELIDENKRSWVRYYLFPNESKGFDTWTAFWLSRRNAGLQKEKELELCRIKLKSFFYHVKVEYDRNKERKENYKEFMTDDPLTSRVTDKFIRLVEPMDFERCKSHPNCQWDRDKPIIYDWLRMYYNEVDKLQRVSKNSSSII